MFSFTQKAHAETKELTLIASSLCVTDFVLSLLISYDLVCAFSFLATCTHHSIENPVSVYYVWKGSSRAEVFFAFVGKTQTAVAPHRRQCGVRLQDEI